MQVERLLVSQKELKTLVGIPYSGSHLLRLERQQRFPQRIRLGACRVAWKYEEILNWVNEKAAEAEREQSPES